MITGWARPPGLCREYVATPLIGGDPAEGWCPRPARDGDWCLTHANARRLCEEERRQRQSGAELRAREKVSIT